MLHYLIQIIAFQLFFLIVYDVFLKKETFFNWNRAYLLITAVLSIILPFVKINQLHNVVPQEYVINLPEVIIGDLGKQPLISNNIQTIGLEASQIPTWQLVFYLGITLTAGLFVFKMSKILWLIIKNPKFKEGKMLIVNVLNSRNAFSFLNVVFLGDKINPNDKTTILKHERVHVKQKHTLDLLFFEALKIVFWFNPLIYMFQIRIAALHEFIADSKASKQLDASQYYQNLLSQVFDTNKVSFINTFYKQSLIKKRIIMLSKSKSKNHQLIKYALLIPIVLSMLIYTSASSQDKSKSQLEKNLKKNNEKIEEVMNIFSEFKEETKGVEVYSEEQYLKRKEISILFNEYVFKNFEKKLDSIGSYSNKRSALFEEYKKETYEEYLKKMNTVDGLKKRMNIKLLNSDWDLTEGSYLFSELDKLPVFPGCEDRENEKDIRACFSENLSKIVTDNFDLSIAKTMNLKHEVQLIQVMFDISEKGEIENIKARAFTDGFENEAIRVAKLFPKMTPGKKDNKSVRTTYVLPIKFKIEK